jgi:Flp pilus assembly protein TadD
MRNEALQKLTAVTTGDPRVLALQVRTLIALGRTGEAEVVFQRLRKGGYRDPARSDAAWIARTVDASHEAPIRVGHDASRQASLVASTSTQPE